MDVDEAGRHHQAAGIDDRLRLRATPPSTMRPPAMPTSAQAGPPLPSTTVRR
jgi:hypothetical protein